MAERLRCKEELHARARAIKLLAEAGVPFLVGGAYAFAHYTGIYRDTKDLDLFPKKSDAEVALEVLKADGWQTERTDEKWIYKAFCGEYFVDFIFCSGNGVAQVDDEWFAHAPSGIVFEHPVQLVPAEEMVWSKAYVQERERYDGADVIHLIKCAGRSLNWKRLLDRFADHWEVLFSQLLLFRFVYPSERETIPEWVMEELIARSAQTLRDGNENSRVCRGTLLSRVNYGVDLHEWGYLDARESEPGPLRGGERFESGSELQDTGGGRG